MIICLALELILPCYTSAPTKPTPLCDMQKPRHELDFPDPSKRLCTSTELPVAPNEPGIGEVLLLRTEWWLVFAKQPSLSCSDPSLHKRQQKEPGSVRAAWGRHTTKPRGPELRTTFFRGTTIFPETLGIYASFSASDPEAESDLEAQPSPLQNGFWCTPKSHCPYSHLVFHHLCFPEWFSLISTREKSQWSNPTSLVPSVPANNTQGRGCNSTNIVYRKNCKTTTTSHTTDLPSFMYVFYTNQLTLNWKITNFTNLSHTDKYLYKNGTNKQKQQWKKMKETKAKTTINSFTQSEWEHFINVNGIRALDNAPLSMWFTMTRSVI